MRARVLAMIAAMQFSNGIACDVTFEEGWVAQAPPVSMMRAGYGIARNQGDNPAVIENVVSAQFSSTTLHETIMQTGMDHMQRIEHAAIPAHGELRFTPNGRHIMLMKPTTDLENLRRTSKSRCSRSPGH